MYTLHISAAEAQVLAPAIIRERNRWLAILKNGTAEERKGARKAISRLIDLHNKLVEAHTLRKEGR